MDVYDVILTTPVMEEGGKLCKRDVPPISLVHVSSVLNAEKKKVKIFDLYQTQDNETMFREKLRNYSATTWGITCDVTDRFQAFRTAAAIKEVYPKSTVVLGGIFATQAYETILEDVPEIDIVVSGEGEHAILEILKWCEDGGDLGEIKGISWRQDGNIIHNESRPYWPRLDELPNPFYNAIDHKLYANEFKHLGFSESQYPSENYDGAMGHLIFSRGCPFHCIFCTSRNQGFLTYRILSPENAVAQIMSFYDQGTRNFIFWDDHLMLKKDWFSEFAEKLLEKDIKIFFKVSSRIDALNEDNIRLLKQMGCVKVTLGVEYGETDMLESIGKNITTEQIADTYRLLHKYDIRIGGGMLSNFPGETFETVNKSFKFFKTITQYGFPSSFVPSPVQVHPGTTIDNEHWQKKHPNFRWTQPFFDKTNLYMNASPYIPLWQNVPTIKNLRWVIKAAFKNESFGTLYVILCLFVLYPDKIYLRWYDRLYLRLNVIVTMLWESTGKVGFFATCMGRGLQKIKHKILENKEIFPALNWRSENHAK